ncbi:MAG: translation elongation factor Ts [Clostridia bacterium]|nr:translation elongation factor Ts [Clostridia bacterium]MBR2323904.1 translation elongation factor Ts [Clostridia bacterium]MBR2397265.1 translation elongation factor Ts [Clostridia bacterium]MBR2875173.1 translation elongation factor Ts [Clostridia bacterium]
MFTAKDVMDLRAKTGVGMMDCKKALTETNGDVEKAIVLLREKGMATAAKRAGKIASEGVVGSYIHLGGRIGVLIEVNCESDFVARNEDFTRLVKDLAMHIAASKPEYVSREEVDQAKLKQEADIIRAQAMNDPKPKPAAVIEKMVEGRVNKYLEEICLLEQKYVRDPSKTVADVLNEATASIGEKIVVRRFVRYEMGEGLEKKKNDIAAEVAEQIEKMNK